MQSGEGYYYIDRPVAEPIPADPAATPWGWSGDGVDPGVLVLILAVLALLLTGILLGWLLAANRERTRRDAVVKRIWEAVDAQIKAALATYGPAAVPAAEKLAHTIRFHLGPVIALAGGLAGLKSIDEAVKGKAKIDPPKADGAAAGGAAAVVVQQAVVVACGCKGVCTCAKTVEGSPPPAGERDLSSAEQAALARKGVEQIAAFWSQRQTVEKLMRDAGDHLARPRRETTVAPTLSRG